MVGSFEYFDYKPEQTERKKLSRLEQIRFFELYKAQKADGFVPVVKNFGKENQTTGITMTLDSFVLEKGEAVHVSLTVWDNGVISYEGLMLAQDLHGEEARRRFVSHMAENQWHVATVEEAEFIEKVILSPSPSIAVTVPIAETPSATEKVDNDVMLGALSLILLIVTVLS